MLWEMSNTFFKVRKSDVTYAQVINVHVDKYNQENLFLFSFSVKWGASTEEMLFLVFYSFAST